MTTAYPNFIDGPSELPTVPGVDSTAIAINALRSAILAIETELGVTPKAIYPDVGSRLSVLESRIGSTGGGGGSEFTAGGDLSGSNTSQNVISISGVGGAVNIADTGNIFVWETTTTLPGIKQANNTTNSATGATMTIQAQNATGVGATGGTIVITSGTGTITSGNVNIQTGGTTIAQITSSKFITYKGRRMNATFVTGNYTALTTDDLVVVTTNSAGLTINLYASPTLGDLFEVKDGVGNSATNNIIVSGNGHTIDGASSITINQNYAAVSFIYNGTSWNIL